MLKFLGDLLGLNAGNATKDAAAGNARTIRQYDLTGRRLITEGSNKAGGYLAQLNNLYNPLSGATQMQANALGLNGAGGNAAATAAFQANPGYTSQMEQGLQALDRSAAARGQFQSGGTMADTLKFSQGLERRLYHL
jgi:hypothetical protein